jgi:ABC-2 type transport system ATP-binding protein
VIEVERVTRLYATGTGETAGVKDFSLSAPAGSITGLLGPNGAGKTTLLKVVVGIVQPNSGRVLFDGIDPRQLPERRRIELKRRIGFSPEVPFFYSRLTGHECLSFVAGLYGRSPGGGRAWSALATVFRMTRDLDKPMENCSQGMLRKVSLIAALSFGQDLIILDEPCNGLDPEMVAVLKSTLALQRQEGKTVLMSTHRLDVAEQLCDRVCVMHRGRNLFAGDPAALRGVPGRDLEEVFLTLTSPGRMTS